MPCQINLQNQQNPRPLQGPAVQIPAMIRAVQVAVVPILVISILLYSFFYIVLDSDSKPVVTKQPSKQANLGATGGFADDDQTILNHLMSGK